MHALLEQYYSLSLEQKIGFGIGFIAQAMFTGRFIVQWVASERKGESVVPVSFWWLSIFGSGLLLGYAVWRRDPVFMFGQTTGTIVYIRNLMIIAKKAEAKRVAEASSDEPPLRKAG